MTRSWGMHAMPDASEEQVKEYRIAARRGREGTWLIAFHEDRIELSERRGRVCAEILREARGRDAILKEIPLSKPLLVVRIPDKVTFELGKTAEAAFKEWRGPLDATDLKAELRSWLILAIPVGLIILLGSLPLPADETAGAPSTPLDPTGLALGLSFVGLGVLSRLWTDPRVLLLLTAWFLAAGIEHAVYVIRGGNPGWLLAVLAAVLFALWSLRSFSRFKGVRRSPGGETT